MKQEEIFDMIRNSKHKIGDTVMFAYTNKDGGTEAIAGVVKKIMVTERHGRHYLKYQINDSTAGEQVVHPCVRPDNTPKPRRKL